MEEKKIFNIHALQQKVIKEGFGDVENLHGVIEAIL